MKAISMKSWKVVLVLSLVAGSLGGSLLAAQASGGVSGRLGTVRAATAAFKDVANAQAAGYESFLDCFDNPGVGGMGQHYVRLDQLDASLNAVEPESLVYLINDGKFRLAAVEYIVPKDAWSDEDPPMVLGQPLHLLPDLGVFVLHAWIWRSNPLGVFQDYNPNVRPCP